MARVAKAWANAGRTVDFAVYCYELERPAPHALRRYRGGCGGDRQVAWRLTVAGALL